MAPIVVRLCLMLSKRAGSDEDAELLQRMYAADLADLPYFAVERACDAYRRGEVGDGKWLPTVAELRRLAGTHCADLKRELAEISAVLEAEIVPAVEFSEFGKELELNGWKKIRAEIVLNDPRARTRKPMSQITPKEAQAALERMASEPPPAITLSDSLRLKLTPEITVGRR